MCVLFGWGVCVGGLAPATQLATVMLMMSVPGSEHALVCLMLFHDWWLGARPSDVDVMFRAPPRWVAVYFSHVLCL